MKNEGERTRKDTQNHSYSLHEDLWYTEYMRILIVEDEAAIAQAVKKMLEHEGFAVDWLSDGNEARQRISLYRKEYDLVILDLMLPGISGYDICRSVREDGVNMPILILTARDLVHDKVSLLDTGADDYLVKPFSFEELFARIKALLRRPKEVLPVALSVGTLMLDTKTRKVSFGKKVLDLTTKEYALLEYLMRHPDEVVDRERIMDHLWGFEFDSFSNVVDVHIKNLRKKLDPKKGRAILETVRGVGYRLNSSLS